MFLLLRKTSTTQPYFMTTFHTAVVDALLLRGNIRNARALGESERERNCELGRERQRDSKHSGFFGFRETGGRERLALSRL